MSDDAFTTAVTFVLQREGGYENDPNDPGGETNFGIDKKSHPDVDIRNLTREAAIAIYREVYWLGSNADKLPPALAIVYFDAAVNQGCGYAARSLQAVLGVTADGAIGPATLSALTKVPLVDVIVEFAARRALRYGSLPGFTRYGLGWSRRLMACLALSLRSL